MEFSCKKQKNFSVFEVGGLIVSVPFIYKVPVTKKFIKPFHKTKK